MPVVVHKRGPRYELQHVRELLGSADAPEVPQLSSPALWTDGALHLEASEWLRIRFDQLRNDDTVGTNAERLAGWIHFLRERRQRTVHTATEDDYRAYEISKRYPSDGTEPTTDNWWSNTKSAIKQFHEWLETTYGTPTPFTVVPKSGPHGTVLGIPDAGRLVTSAPQILPLIPRHLDTLVDATKAPTPRGRPPRHPRRNRAIVQLMAGTGIRIGPASLLTTYEIPTVTPETGSYLPAIIPGTINKYRRTVHARAFAHRLRDVNAYIHGERRIMLDGTTYQPADPLQIVEADGRRVTFVDHHGNELRRHWPDVTGDQRRRLVTPDGHPAIVFVQSTGKPLSVPGIRDAFSAALAHAQTACEDFPAGVHPHSLRHTYATYLAHIYLLQDPELFGSVPAVRDRRSAAEFVQRELGHVSSATTEIYIGFLESIAGEPLDRVKGVR